MRRILMLLVCAMFVATFVQYSDSAEGALLEDAIWEMIDCPFDSDEVATTIVDGTDGYLYIGTADSTDSHTASIYRWDGTTCTQWQNLPDLTYYIYSSVVYNGTIFFGTRDAFNLPPVLPSTLGSIFYYDIGTDTFAELNENTWWNDVGTTSAWVQAMYVHDDRMFISGSRMDKSAPSVNNFYVKYCYNTDCDNAGDWAWVTTTEVNLGEIDDAISMATYQDELYIGTYDPASVLRYYNSNQSVWYSLNETFAQAVHSTYPDGVPYTTASQGFYGLTVMDGQLNAFSYAWGHNWTLAGTGLNWEFNNITTNYARSILYRGDIYLGAYDGSDMLIQRYDNFTFQDLYTDEDVTTDFWLYFEEFEGELYATNENNLYRRRVDPPLVEITSPNQGESVVKYVNFAAYVNEDSKTVSNIYFTLNSVSYTPTKVTGTYNWVHKDYDTTGLANTKHTLVLTVLWTDGTYSRDSVDFFVYNKPGNRLDCIVQENGNLICMDNPPYKPKWGNARLENLLIVDPYVHIQYDVIDTPSSAASVNLYLPYETGEGSATIMSDELHVSGTNSTDRVWLNDTAGTITNGLGFTYYNLMGAGNSNYTVESECVLTVTRTTSMRIIREFNWSGDPTTGRWNMEYFTFTNEIDSGNTIRNVWFYWSKAPDTTIDQEEMKIKDNTNNQELDPARHYSADYGGFQLQIDSLAYQSSRSFSIEYYEDFENKVYNQMIPIYDSDMVMEGGFSSAPWHVEKSITMTTTDFDGMVIFVFKATNPVKDKKLNPKSIIIERDQSIIDKWVYLDHTNQILVFDQKISARSSTTYDIWFDFYEPQDLALNIMIDNHIAFIILGLVLIGASLKPIFNEDEDPWYRYLMAGAFGTGLIIIVIVGIAML